MTRTPIWITLCATVVLVLAAAILSPYQQFIAGEFAAVVIIALGLNLLLGVAGLLSLASGAFVGLGATMTVTLLIHGNVPVPLAVIAAMFCGWVAGLILGLISLRLAGYYLAVVTLGFLQVVVTVLKGGGVLTGGSYGLVVPPVSLPVIGVVAPQDWSLAAVAVAVLCVGAVYTMTNSRVGRAWLADKDHAVAAALSGVDAVRTRTLAFATSSALIALGGAMQALLLGITHPDAYDVMVSVDHISYVVVGGMEASVAGPVLGSALLFLGPEVLRDLGQWRDLVFAAVLLVTLVFLPGGLVGLLARGVRVVTRTRKTVR